MSKYAFVGIILQACLSSILLATNGSMAQRSVENVHLGISMKKAELTAIFEEIESKTGFAFAYKIKDVRKEKTISLDFKEESLGNILRYISKKSDLTFKRVNNQITVKKDANSFFGVREKTNKVEELADVDISGRVTDESGAGLPGASIVQKGTSKGTTSDLDGNYSLTVSDGAILTISFVGYKTQEIIVGTQTVIDIQMVLDAEQLEEIVVVGYGSQARAEVTGAISTVSDKEITALPITNAEQALQGRAAGVMVRNTGAPGTAPIVRIRGMGTPNNNDPLYVVDGVIVGNLNGISPADIESVNILKDASTAAIYGSRGSNGVVMVTTKKGSQSGQQISLNSYWGTQKISQRHDIMNRQQYLAYAEDALDFTIARTDPAFTDTDWQDEVLPTGFIQSYDVSLSGGGDGSRYRFSAGYLDQEGAIIETGFERYSFRANSDFSLGKLKIGESLSLAFNSQNPERGSGRTMLEHAIKIPPYLPVHNTDNLGGFQGPNTAVDGQDAENPVRSQSYGNQTINTTAIIGNIFAEYEIMDGLTFKTQVGLDLFTSKDEEFRPAYDDDNLGGTHVQDFAQIRKNVREGRTIIVTNSLNYQKTFGDAHTVEVLALVETNDQEFNNINTESRNNISNEIQQVSNISSVLGSSTDEIYRIGYLGRLNYNYDGKYLLSGSIRRDASSKFGQNNRWGVFPSVSAGWNIAMEDFMADAPFSNLKLRASWGVTGNDRIPNYLFTSTLNSNFFYPINGQATNGATASGLPNQDLKWEETTMTNIGLDVGLLEGKLTASLEYFNNKSDDLLIGIPLATSLGFSNSTFFDNVGSVKTKGLEFSVGYNDAEGEFQWSANLQLGHNSNELVSLAPGITEGFAGGNNEDFGAPLVKSSLGQPLYYFYGLIADGIFQTQEEVDAVYKDSDNNNGVGPGDIRHVDVNGDGLINDNDKGVIGNPYPDITYGLNFNGTYRRFDFNLFLTGVSGNQIYNTTLFDLVGQSRLFNASVDVLNRWTGPGTSNTIPRAAGEGGANFNNQVSTRFLEDGSYTRLKTISVGYNVPSDAIAGGKVFSNLRVYISGQNLLTITDYSGLDPEIANSRGGANVNQEYGTDRGTYPQPKSVIFGIQATF
ncbi:MAG: TonB-dependent receptor [Cyclobacteriaceae bacterium]